MADEQTTQTTEQELAAASAPAEQNEQAPEGADKQTEPARTFTQEEVNKIVSERQKRWEKKAADERAEAERVATMTAEQKALHEQEKRAMRFSRYFSISSRLNFPAPLDFSFKSKNRLT